MREMKFINSSNRFPFSDAVIYSGRILETVLTGIPPGEEWPLKGGVKEELQEIFRQLDSILAQAGATKTSVVSARLSQMLTGILSLSTRFTKVRRDSSAQSTCLRRYAAFVAELSNE
jgi:hypothetical protein